MIKTLHSKYFHRTNNILAFESRETIFMHVSIFQFELTVRKKANQRRISRGSDDRVPRV